LSSLANIPDYIDSIVEEKLVNFSHFRSALSVPMWCGPPAERNVHSGFSRPKVKEGCVGVRKAGQTTVRRRTVDGDDTRRPMHRPSPLTVGQEASPHPPSNGGTLLGRSGPCISHGSTGRIDRKQMAWRRSERHFPLSRPSQ